MVYNDRELLARTLQAEAGNQGFGGMLAAGSVIANRVGAGGYGGSLREVILKPGQFSAWNSLTGYAGGEQGQDMGNMRPSQDAYKAADAILSGEYQDVTGGATHYFNPDISQPEWGQSGQWKRIGDHVFGSPDAGRSNQRGTSKMDQQQPTAQQMQQMAAPQQRGGLMGFLSNPRTREALLSMSRSGLTEGLLQRATADVNALEKREAEQAKANRTAQWLRTQPDGERYAQAIESGMNAKTVYSQYMREKQADSDPNVQSRTMLPDNSGSVVTMRDGTQFVLTSGGQRLTGAEADAFVQKAQQAYTQQQQDIYSARRTGTLDADLELGGQVEQVKSEGKNKVKWIDDVRGQYENIKSAIGNYDMALQALDNNASTGRIASLLPTVTAQTQLLETAKKRLGLDVIGSVTFGALSEGELALAMDTGLPSDNLGPEELRKWIMERKVASEKAAQALLETATYLADPETTYQSYYRDVLGIEGGGTGGTAATQSDDPLGLSIQ